MLSLRSEVVLADLDYADLIVFSLDFRGYNGMRLSVFVGGAREASGLEVWVVSARMGSRGRVFINACVDDRTAIALRTVDW
jgi:hypothetical protein